MKKIQYLVQYMVLNDDRNYRRDREEDRVLFYGDEEAVKLELTKRNQSSIDMEIKLLEESHKGHKATVVAYKKAKKLHDSLPESEKKLVRLIHNWDYEAAIKAIDTHSEKVEKLRTSVADYYPNTEYSCYWTDEGFGLEGSNLEWVEDEFGNVIGFREKSE